MKDTDNTKLDCAGTMELLDAFHDMELDVAEAEAVEMHLADCAACRAELDAIEKVVASLKSLPEPLPTKDFADLIEARILRQAAPAAQDVEPPHLTLVSDKDNVRSIRATPRRSRGFYVVAAAALLLCGLMAISSFNSQPPAQIARAPQAGKVATPGGNIRTASNDLNADIAMTPVSDDVVALYDEEGGSNVSDVGISTNEDGLYAIKM